MAEAKTCSLLAKPKATRKGWDDSSMRKANRMMDQRRLATRMLTSRPKYRGANKSFAAEGAEWGAWRAGVAGETSPAGSSGAEPNGGGAGPALGPRGWPWQRPLISLSKLWPRECGFGRHLDDFPETLMFGERRKPSEKQPP